MIEVAAGVLTDTHGRVLLMQRLPGTHLAGSWEFPGGKLEPGETVGQALARELREELGIEASAFAPLISVPWRYPEKAIRLHALCVTRWRGEPHAREGHPLRWAALRDMDADTMPQADRPIVTALRLPSLYAISPPDLRDADSALAWLEKLPSHAGKKGSGSFFDAAPSNSSVIVKNEPDPFLVQLRLLDGKRDSLRTVALHLLMKTPTLASRLLLNSDIELARELSSGVHLRAAQLRELDARPLVGTAWVGASCHGAEDLERAADIDADFAVLGPVRATASHPDAQPLGWERFMRLVADARLPVYALGGVVPDDLDTARAAGAQGVAGIRAFLN